MGLITSFVVCACGCGDPLSHRRASTQVHAETTGGLDCTLLQSMNRLKACASRMFQKTRAPFLACGRVGRAREEVDNDREVSGLSMHWQPRTPAPQRRRRRWRLACTRRCHATWTSVASASKLKFLSACVVASSLAAGSALQPFRRTLKSLASSVTSNWRENASNVRFQLSVTPTKAKRASVLSARARLVRTPGSAKSSADFSVLRLSLASVAASTNARK